MKYSIPELSIKATRVWIEKDMVCLRLADDREIRFPAKKNKRLHKAAAPQLANVEIICDGTGIHWPDLDEDLTVQGIIEGRTG